MFRQSYGVTVFDINVANNDLGVNRLSSVTEKWLYWWYNQVERAKWRSVLSCRVQDAFHRWTYLAVIYAATCVRPYRRSQTRLASHFSAICVYRHRSRPGHFYCHTILTGVQLAACAIDIVTQQKSIHSYVHKCYLRALRVFCTMLRSSAIRTLHAWCMMRDICM